MNYIPLRVKTSYSLLKSLNDIKKMVLFCKNNNISTVGIDDDNMYGVMEFYKECKKNDVKPIIGLEINIGEDIAILYAKNYEGYQNLTRITYIKQSEELNIEILKKYSGNLICISNENLYKDLSKIYKDTYLGYSNIDRRPTNLTKKTIYVNNILCEKKEDIEYLKYLYLIKNDKKINELNTCVIPDNCYFDFNRTDYEISKELADKCNVEFPTNKSLMPKYEVENSKDYLFNLCKKGLYKRLDGKVTKTYYDRLLYELNVIDKMGFNDYFLVVWDYVRY